jgi:hypothetical protein
MRGPLATIRSSVRGLGESTPLYHPAERGEQHWTGIGMTGAKKTLADQPSHEYGHVAGVLIRSNKTPVELFVESLNVLALGPVFRSKGRS